MSSLRVNENNLKASEEESSFFNLTCSKCSSPLDIVTIKKHSYDWCQCFETTIRCQCGFTKVFSTDITKECKEETEYRKILPLLKKCPRCNRQSLMVERFTREDSSSSFTMKQCLDIYNRSLKEQNPFCDYYVVKKN